MEGSKRCEVDELLAEPDKGKTKLRCRIAVVVVAFICLVLAAVAFVVLTVAYVSRDDTPQYFDDIDETALMMYMQQLQVIADQNGGNRADNSAGYTASVNYVVKELSSNPALRVTLQPFVYYNTRVYGTPVLREVSPHVRDYVYETDFSVYEGSSSGSGVANVTVIAGSGCSIEDYDDFVQGNVAVMFRGTCYADEKAAAAAQAGAIAVIIVNSVSYAGPIESNIEPTFTIPILSLSYARGVLLAEDTQPVVEFNVVMELLTINTTNVLAETIESATTSAIVVGAHLDGSPAGPGINDNGSGVASILALAKAYKATAEPENKIIFAFWGAEEVWLYGSYYYVQNFNSYSYHVEAYINHDMVADPNYVTGLYDCNDLTAESVQMGCNIIASMYETFLEDEGYPVVWVPIAMDTSDFSAFVTAGIPFNGPLACGAGETKTEEEKQTYGGIMNAMYDPCYHDECDTIDNYSPTVLSIHTRATCYALNLLAAEGDLQDALLS